MVLTIMKSYKIAIITGNTLEAKVIFVGLKLFKKNSNTAKFV